MNTSYEKDDFDKLTDKFISEQKFGETINYLHKILKTYIKNEKYLALMEYLMKITKYQYRDIQLANLDMDPWLE